MNIELTEKPKHPTIVQAFPGLGFTGLLAAEFLIDHLHTKEIGRIITEEMAPVIAIHEGEFVEPTGIHYNEKYNMIIIKSVNKIPKSEWLMADTIHKIAEELDAKEIISLDGVGTEELEKTRGFFFTKDAKKRKDVLAFAEPLTEGVIMGVTAAALVKYTIPLMCFFAETHSELPDSKAAAKLIELLDKYMGLKLDFVPLLKTAEKFEKKINQIMEKSKKAEEMTKDSELSYVG